MPEHSTVSSSRDGVVTQMDSSSSTTTARTTTSVEGTERVTESSSSYKTAVGSSGSTSVVDSSTVIAKTAIGGTSTFTVDTKMPTQNPKVDANTARISKGSTELTKPIFTKTIAGSSAERMYKLLFLNLSFQHQRKWKYEDV